MQVLNGVLNPKPFFSFFDPLTSEKSFKLTKFYCFNILFGVSTVPRFTALANLRVTTFSSRLFICSLSIYSLKRIDLYYILLGYGGILLKLKKIIVKQMHN